jgi:plastocyanin domain-containing protein
MDASEIGVIVGGVTLIGFVLWYFFGEREKAVARGRRFGGAGDQGHGQGRLRARRDRGEAGQPVRLDFFRDETSSCTEQVVFGDFGIVRDLPAYKTTPIEFTPDKPGEFTFACGMNMVRGKLIVQPAA